MVLLFFQNIKQPNNRLVLNVLIVFLPRRVARIWKRGGYFERVTSVQTTLTGIFIDLEAVSDGLSEN